MRYVSNMVSVAIRDVLRTGRFGPITLGATAAEITAIIGRPPDDWDAGADRFEDAEIWKYGDLELHFAGSSCRLWLIHADTFETLDGGPIAIDPWFVRRGARRDDVVAELRAAELDFIEDPGARPDDGAWLRFASGAKLHFEDDDGGVSRLSCLSLVDPVPGRP